MLAGSLNTPAPLHSYPNPSHSSRSALCAYADINECTALAACPSGLCLNTEGSYSCMACDAGYTVSRDGSTCEGIPFPGTEERVLEGMREETFLGYWWGLGTSLASESFSSSLAL